MTHTPPLPIPFERYLDLEATLEDLATREVVARATGRFFPLPEAPDGAAATRSA